MQKIGIKTTRMQSLQGEQIVIPNTQLTDSKIHNYQDMKKRRTSFQIGVEYETDSEKLRKIPDMIKNIFDDIGDEIELARVHFIEFGDFSLDYEVVYYVNSGDYNTYRDMDQKLRFAILDKFDKENIGFAYPTAIRYSKKLDG